MSLGKNCVAPLCCVLACSPADRRRKKKDVLKISVAINRMKPNGGIYFQPSGVNSLSSFGVGQATPCLSNMLSFSLANKQQNKYVSVFSQRDGETEILFPMNFFIRDLLMMIKKPTGIFFLTPLLFLTSFYFCSLHLCTIIFTFYFLRWKKTRLLLLCLKDIHL